MAMSLGKLPVYMRIGDSEEYEIGSVELDGELSDDGEGNTVLSADVSKLKLPEFLRAAADAMEEAAHDV
jgi:hypothetical protein